MTLVQSIHTRPAANDRGAGDARGTRVDGQFTEVFEKALGREGIKLTRHARQRIEGRHIRMDETDVESISNAMSKLKGKGGKISLLFMGDTALVTNVNNRTVITALDRYGESDQVFTQIDSAAVIRRG